MALIKYNPWGQIINDDDFLGFNDLFNEIKTAVDVYETKDAVIVNAQLPGFTKDDVKVTIEGSSLTIKAETKENHEEKEGRKYYRKEIKEQSVVRSITLPTPVSSDKAKAEFKNGILKLTLPKTEEAKPKEITINGE